MFRKHVNDRLTAFCENLLPEDEAKAIREHLRLCRRCSQEYEDISRSVSVIQTLHVVPIPEKAELRIRARLRDEMMKSPPEHVSRQGNFRSVLLRAAVLVVVLTAGLFFAVQYHRSSVEIRVQEVSSDLEVAARRMHEEHIRGTLRLDLVTASADEARGWMRSNALPVARISGNRPEEESDRFQLQGVKRILVREKAVLLVAYRIDSRPVTLLTASEADFNDVPTSGLLSKRVFLSSNSPRGMKIVNWTIGGQTYVLVSDLPGSGLQGCLICHANDTPRKTIEKMEIGETLQSHLELTLNPAP